MEVIFLLVLINTTLVFTNSTQQRALQNSITKLILEKSDASNGSMMTQVSSLAVGMAVSLCGNSILILIPVKTKWQATQYLNSNSKMWIFLALLTSLIKSKSCLLWAQTRLSKKFKATKKYSLDMMLMWISLR